jgi:hypothetical protein
MIEWMRFICYNGSVIVVRSGGCGNKSGNKMYKSQKIGFGRRK